MSYEQRRKGGERRANRPRRPPGVMAGPKPLAAEEQHAANQEGQPGPPTTRQYGPARKHAHSEPADVARCARSQRRDARSGERRERKHRGRTGAGEEYSGGERHRCGDRGERRLVRQPQGESDQHHRGEGSERQPHGAPGEELATTGVVVTRSHTAIRFFFFFSATRSVQYCSHACAYGYVAYQTAYLKAHHPVEFMSAMLTSVKDDKDRKPFYLNACRLMGIEVLPPDVNESETDFAPARGSGRRHPLRAVRRAQRGRGRRRPDHRRPPGKGAFTSFGDFCRKVEPSVLTKRVLESLIFAGAFDSLGYARRALIENQDKVSAPILAERKAEAAGQFSLFGGDSGSPRSTSRCSTARSSTSGRCSARRRRCWGSSSPTIRCSVCRTCSAAQTTHEIVDLEILGDGDLVTIGGIIGARATQVHEAERAVRAVPAGGARRAARR